MKENTNVVTGNLALIILIFALIGFITVFIITIKIIKRFCKSIYNIFSEINAVHRRKSIKKTKRKSAKDYAAMTPQERQNEFFNACWEEIERKK